jgi:hypothetical protein
MTYWLVANGQRIVCVVKVESTYQVFYLGKFFPYATPGQYPYPVAVGSTLPTDSLTRYSDVNLSIPFKGARAQMRIRQIVGTWIQPDAWPWNSGTLVAGSNFRDLNGDFPMLPVVLNDAGPNVYGELDGVFFVPGFGNAAENIVVAGGDNYLVVPDVYRNGVRDYFAMRLV